MLVGVQGLLMKAFGVIFEFRNGTRAMTAGVCIWAIAGIHSNA